MKNKPAIAIIRGKHLNQYEMQIFTPLLEKYNVTAFGSLTPFHKEFPFPAKFLPSPMDLPDFSFKMPLLNRVFTDAQYLFGLEGQLKGFDIVHSAETYYHYTQQALHAKKKGYVKKVVATVLENIPFNNEGIHTRVEFKKRARQELDYMIALTERTKNALLLEGADEKKITVIGHGIDTERFSPKQKKPKRKTIEILFSGRLEKYKGIYEVIYALKRLLADPALKDYMIHLTMVGDGSEKQKLRSVEKFLKIERNILHTTVSYAEMPAVFQQADVYVAPSKPDTYWLEQYNTTLLEAQATGLPIVTTYSGGIPENVGNAAILVPPNDSYAVYQELKAYILSPKKREAYAKKARLRAKSVHDIHVIANKIDIVYKNLL